MKPYIKGLVEMEVVGKNGIVKSRSYNSFLIKGEEIIARFLARSFASKYDDNEGATQAGYFDFVAIGTGFKTPIAGTDRIIVLPNKPYGILDENIDAFDSKTVKILSGANSGVNAVVVTDGYNPANLDYEGKPTITLVDPLSFPVEEGVQFVISQITKEQTLQGENRADYKGASFLNPNASRVKILEKKTLSAVSTPAGSENEVYFTTILPATQLSGGSSVLICEAGIVNTEVIPSDPASKSGEMMARVLLTPTEKGPEEQINLNWRLRIGGQRELSI